MLCFVVLTITHNNQIATTSIAIVKYNKDTDMPLIAVSAIAMVQAVTVRIKMRTLLFAISQRMAQLLSVLRQVCGKTTVEALSQLRLGVARSSLT